MKRCSISLYEKRSFSALSLSQQLHRQNVLAFQNIKTIRSMIKAFGINVKRKDCQIFFVSAGAARVLSLPHAEEN